MLEAMVLIFIKRLLMLMLVTKVVIVFEGKT